MVQRFFAEKTDARLEVGADEKLDRPREQSLADVDEQAFQVERPVAGEETSVPDVLLDFSIKVKNYLRTKDPTLREEARVLYERLVPLLSPTDPRLAALDTLKGMLA